MPDTDIGRKIVCTIGPTSESVAVLRRLMDSGMDVARLNLSHGSHADHRKRFDDIRTIDRRVAVMFDLQGPKIRLGHFPERSEQFLKRGDTFVLTSRSVPGSVQIASVDYPSLPEIVSPKDTIFVNDGLVELKVEKIDNGTDVVCRVRAGGEIGTGKGVNVPGKSSEFSGVTEKDREDLSFLATLEPDFVSVSFVSSAGDVAEVREILNKKGAVVPLIAKIERREAVRNFEAILGESDGIMIARGDLAVEATSEKVPPLQKDFIKMARQSGKPVICATQMLESMRFHSRPTRAEASDVFNAVLDGADALMLSGETANGKYPLQTLKMMKRLIKEGEAFIASGKTGAHAHQPEVENGDILAEALPRFSLYGGKQRKHLKIILYPVTGGNLTYISTLLSGSSILVPTYDLSLLRRLRAYGGLSPQLIRKDTLEQGNSSAIVSELRKSGAVKARDRIVAVRLRGEGDTVRVRSVEHV